MPAHLYVVQPTPQILLLQNLGNADSIMGFDFSDQSTQNSRNEFGFTGMDQGPSMQDEQRSIEQTGMPTVVNRIDSIINSPSSSSSNRDITKTFDNGFFKGTDCDPAFDVCSGARMVAISASVLALGGLVSCM